MEVALIGGVLGLYGLLGNRRGGIESAVQSKLIELQNEMKTSKATLLEMQRVRERDREAFSKKLDEQAQQLSEELRAVTREGGRDQERRSNAIIARHNSIRENLPAAERERRADDLIERLAIQLLKMEEDAKALQNWAAAPGNSPKLQFGRDVAYDASLPDTGLACHVNQDGFDSFGVKVEFKNASATHKAFLQEIRSVALPADVDAKMEEYSEIFRGLPPSPFVASLVGYLPTGQLPRRSGNDGDGVGLVWEHFGMASLEELAYNSGSSYTVRQALLVLKDICQGLNHLHVNGLYHGGLTPSNIRVGPSAQGTGLRVKLVEAGLAIRKQGFEEEATSRGHSTGTTVRMKTVTKNVTPAEVLSSGEHSGRFDFAWVGRDLEERGTGNGDVTKYNLPIALNPKVYHDPLTSTSDPLLGLSVEVHQSVDCFRLGMVAVGLFSRRPPCEKGQEKAFRRRMKVEGHRPEIPRGMPQGVAEVVSLLLTSPQAAGRPSAETVLERVEDVIGELGEGNDGGSIPPAAPLSSSSGGPAAAGGPAPAGAPPLS